MVDLKVNPEIGSQIVRFSPHFKYQLPKTCTVRPWPDTKAGSTSHSVVL